MKQYHLFSALLIVLFAACEKEIEFKGDTSPQLVLNCLLTPGSDIRVHLSESRFFLSTEKEFKNIEHAEVMLWKDGKVMDTFEELGNGDYLSLYRPKTGDYLRITASAPGLSPVECSAEILPAPEILSAEIVPAKILKSSNEYFDREISLRLKDPGGIPIYYRITAYLRIYSGDEDYIDLPVEYESNDIVFDSPNPGFLGTNKNHYYIFTNALFSGSEYTLKLHVFTNYDYYRKEKKESTMELHIDLQNITKDYYLYLRSRNANWTTDEIDLMFTEPIQIYNNIQGGIGILGSYTSAIFKFLL